MHFHPRFLFWKSLIKQANSIPLKTLGLSPFYVYLSKNPVESAPDLCNEEQLMNLSVLRLSTLFQAQSSISLDNINLLEQLSNADVAIRPPLYMFLEYFKKPLQQIEYTSDLPVITHVIHSLRSYFIQELSDRMFSAAERTNQLMRKIQTISIKTSTIINQELYHRVNVLLSCYYQEAEAIIQYMQPQQNPVCHEAAEAALSTARERFALYQEIQFSFQNWLGNMIDPWLISTLTEEQFQTYATM